MNKDPRYGAVTVLFDAGSIKSIRDIFQFIPKTIVYKDLGINFNRFDKAIYDPSIFRVQELMELADLFGIDRKQFIDMAYEQLLTVLQPASRTFRYITSRRIYG